LQVEAITAQPVRQANSKLRQPIAWAGIMLALSLAAFYKPGFLSV